jgi:PAS domain S-box-containing protein
MEDRESTYTTALSEMIKVLTLGDERESLNRTLALIASALSAEGVAFVKKHFVDRGKFVLELIRMWESNEAAAEATYSKSGPLGRESLPDDLWKRLSSHEILFMRKTALFSVGLKNLALVPVFLEKILYGFLAIWDWRDQGQRSIHHFMEAAGRVLELWIGKLNAEKRLSDIIQFIPSPILALDHNGTAIIWNKSVEEMTGLKAETILGKGNHEHSIPFYKKRRITVLDLILHPNPEWESKYIEFRKEKDTIFSVTYCPALPGGGAFISCKTSILRDLNNRVWGAIQMIRDITRERQIEKNLRQSEFMYRAITDFAGIGMMLFRKDKILYHNEQLLKFVGVLGREMALNDLFEWVYPDDRTKVIQNLEKLFAGKMDVSRFEFSAQNHDRLNHYSCYAQVLEYEDQGTVHFIVDDITEQKELAHKARANELRMYHDDRLTALGTMAAGIAHELNQPLNTIRVVTDGFLFGREEGWSLNQEDLFEGLKMISDQVSRMSEVIRNIRDFAREDRGQQEDEVSPNEAVRNVFSMIGRQLEAHSIKVSRYLTPNLHPIGTSRNRLEQVIMNFVVNARDALDECHHENKELWVRTGTRDGSIFIEVGDNATGIPEGIITKIFDPFFTTKEVGRGTGLGLTISQSIVAEFKGRMEVFNNEKGGATFIITAPASGASNEHPVS